MFYFTRRSVLHSRDGFTVTAQNPSMAVSQFIRYLTSHHSFTVSYLINKCGLSPKCALSISKRVQFETPEKPDLILSFLEKFGFSKTQISEMIRKSPETLSPNPEKEIFPKVEFFRSRGASTTDVVRIFTSCPWMFKLGLESTLIRGFNFYRDLLQSEEKAIAAVKRSPYILSYRFANVKRNVNTLKENGVTAANILRSVQCQPGHIFIYSDKFSKIVKKLKKMGLNPSKSEFVIALSAFIGFSKSIRDKKADAYKKWGWSDNDILTALKEEAWYMTFSENKIMAMIDLYVNKLGLDSKILAQRPFLFRLSLKKIIPRVAVLQFLSSKGLVKLDSSIAKKFKWTEKRFLEEVVNCQEEVPDLLKLYNEKLDLLKQEDDMRDKKADAYKKWGWSDSDILTAFNKEARCVTFSESKIMAVMDLYVNKLGLDSKILAQRPFLLGLNLKKKIIPRVAVLQFLSSKGLVKLDSSIAKKFKWREKRFLEKVVNCHEEAPHLLKLYNEKLYLLKQQDDVRDKKADAYKKWGWSDSDILTAFKKEARCVTFSESKIMAVMDLYVNKLGLDSKILAHRPFLLGLKKKKIIPRVAVLQFLSSKGLVKLDSSIVKKFKWTEKRFLEEVVNCHEEAPDLLKLYNEKLDLLKQQDDMRDKKADAYKKWGWSDNDILTAFRKEARCVTFSESKIMAVMDLYVNKLGLDSKILAQRPFLLGLNLKKKIIPRVAVLQFLSSKGLVKLDSSIAEKFGWREKRFLEKVVNCHEEAPHLLKLYNERLYLLKQQDDLKKTG